MHIVFYPDWMIKWIIELSSENILNIKIRISWNWSLTFMPICKIIIGSRNGDFTGCLKKTPFKEMCDFLTLKMLPLAPALIKTKNRHLFDPLVKNWLFSMENSLQASKTLNSHVKWAFSDQWVKKMAIFCFDQRQSQLFGAWLKRDLLSCLFCSDIEDAKYCLPCPESSHVPKNKIWNWSD